MIYITTSIAYPNSKPHIGYALELVQADFLARYYAAKGEPVQLLTGVDEHGLKIQQAAEEAGISPEKYVTGQSALFQKLADQLGVRYDRYIHTTDVDHILMAQALWRRCLAAGDIYRKPYRAWYDIKEETFLGSVEEFPDAKVFGIDPRFIEQINEENYFFRLSRYQEQIEKLLESGELHITPASRAVELLNFIRDKGLEDISISRDISRLAWGVPVPEDPRQVMYVWFDALTNYLTAAATIDENGEIQPGEFWPATIHCIGYDIQRFHAIIWPAMLLSAGLSLPKELLVHGFITDENGQKMSKSLGNVIDPVPLVEQFGQDPIRWYLLKEVSTTVDVRIRATHIDEVYVSDLGNTLGNLVSRLLNMTTRYCNGTIEEGITLSELSKLLAKTKETYAKKVEARDIQGALQSVLALLTMCNQTIEEYKPWQMAKDPGKQTELETLLTNLWSVLREALVLLAPALPETTIKLNWLLEGEQKVPTETPILFPRLG